MKKPIEYFKPLLPEPSDYSTSLPNFCNAYICASIAKLARKEAVESTYTDDKYKEAVRATLRQWGIDGANDTVFINSRWIPGARPGTQGLIFFNEGTAFIVFRSTERKINDWYTNFKFYLTNYPYAKGTRVHTGFLEAFSTLLPQEDKPPLPILEEVVAQIRDAKAVWVTGHSLGGALASIATSWLLYSGIPSSRLYTYTFGAPRVGNEKYRDHMNVNLTYRYWRFHHESDIVPDLLNRIPRLSRHFPEIIRTYSREGNVLRLHGDDFNVLRLVYGDGNRRILEHYHGLTWAHHAVDLYRDCLFKLCCKDKLDFPKMLYEGIPSEIKLETTPEDIEENKKKLED